MDIDSHPHAYTLQLFELALDRLPPGFDLDRKAHYEKKLSQFKKNPEASYEQIRLAITQLGKESWAERRAYQDMYDRYGRASEESFLLKNLDKGIRDKFMKFIDKGGKLNYLEGIRNAQELTEPPPFEKFFTPEEKYAISQALLKARDSARQEIDGLVIGRRKREYQKLVRHYEQKKEELSRRIEELRSMADLSDKWRDTILDRVRVLEEGWSVMEQSFDEEKLEKEIEYWRGTLQDFLHA